MGFSPEASGGLLVRKSTFFLEAPVIRRVAFDNMGTTWKLAHRDLRTHRDPNKKSNR